MESRILAWLIETLHRYWWNIMSHNFVRDNQKKLTHSTIGTQITFTRDHASNLTIEQCILVVTWEPSPYLRPYPISISELARDDICRGKSFLVQQASHLELVSSWAPHWVRKSVWILGTVVSLKTNSFDYCLVEKSLPACVIFCAQYQVSAYALQILARMVWLLSFEFQAWKRPEPWIRQSHTSCPSHGSGWMHLPILVGSIPHASSAPAKSFPCGAVLFWTLCPSLSLVHHHHSASWALYFLHHVPHLPHPAPWSEVATSLRLSLIAFNLSSNVVSSFLVVTSAFLVVVISSSSCIIAVSTCWTRNLATAVSVST